MITHFVMVEVTLRSSPQALHQAIVAELQKQGEPLRWAITAVHPAQQTVSVEAIVTTHAREECGEK